MEQISQGQITIPPKYFNKMAKMEYSRWPIALVREFLQNSVDAGATGILFETGVNGSNSYLSVIDDGCGMNKDTILNKLLYMGGTTKDKTTIGGFGKAKEILFFAWKNYKIITGSWIIEGKGADYKLFKHNNTLTKGVCATIEFYDIFEQRSVQSILPVVLANSDTKAQLFLRAPNLSSRSMLVPCINKNLKQLRSFPWADIYEAEKQSGQSGEVIVRSGGVVMFGSYLYRLNKKIILDLKIPSVECLTANRDALKPPYSVEFSNFISFISNNQNSLSLNIKETDRLEIIPAKQDLPIPSSLRETTLRVRPSGLVKTSDYSFEKDIGYSFAVRKFPCYSKERVKKFFSDPAALPLAELWTKILFEVLISNIDNTFIKKLSNILPGFVFHDRVLGLCDSGRSPPAIFINPISKNIIEAARYGKEVLVGYMEDVATHEIAHLHSRDHSEAYAYTLDNIRHAHRVWKSIGSGTPTSAHNLSAN